VNTYLFAAVAVIAVSSAANAMTYIHEFEHPRMVVHYHPTTAQFGLLELRAALGQGVSAVELDIHLRASDNQVVCNHDSATPESPTLAQALDLVTRRKTADCTINGDGKQFFVVLEPKESSPRLFDAIADVLRDCEHHLSTAVGQKDGPRRLTVVITGAYPDKFYANFRPDVVNRLCVVERHDYAGEISDLSKSGRTFNWVSIRHSKTEGKDASIVQTLQSGTDPSCPGRFNVRIWDCHRDLAIGLAAGADSLNCDIGEIRILQGMLVGS